jgi:hypothetical protein
MDYVSNSDFWGNMNDYYRHKPFPYNSEDYSTKNITRLQWDNAENDKKIKAEKTKKILNSYIGKYFKCKVLINDITQDTVIGLELGVIEPGLIKYNSYCSEHLLHFRYNESFKSRLLNFSKGGDSVKIEGEFISIQEGVITFQLTSIEKGCFIATACYGNYDAPQVLLLQQYRDETLVNFFFGRVFVAFYYFISPYLVKVISKSETLKIFVRNHLLERIVNYLKKQNED